MAEHVSRCSMTGEQKLISAAIRAPPLSNMLFSIIPLGGMNIDDYWFEHVSLHVTSKLTALLLFMHLSL